jgi:hypothetical protein
MVSPLIRSDSRKEKKIVKALEVGMAEFSWGSRSSRLPAEAEPYASRVHICMYVCACMPSPALASLGTAHEAMKVDQRGDCRCMVPRADIVDGVSRPPCDVPAWIGFSESLFCEISNPRSGGQWPCSVRDMRAMLH